MFRNTIAGAVLGAAALATVLSTPADAQRDRVQAGSLECSLSSSIGLIVASQTNIACNYKPDGGPPEAYVGTMTRIGLDVGITGGGAIIWAVFSGTNRYAGMLAGTYVGASAEMIDCRGPWRERAGRRIEPFCRAAAAVGPGPGRPQYRSRRELARIASGAITESSSGRCAFGAERARCSPR